ncbi:MAG: methyltransferase domain-containing protein [Xanthomarina gelatinilytica]|uniref:methyltransferase domain-containing protein n=1 Tax=Xanthomarina gelatinilytica TaxID=1137281 RepID=UPI003A849214
MKRDQEKKISLQKKIRKQFVQNGQIPWSEGYNAFKEESIIKSISNESLLSELSLNRVPTNFGYRLDERIIEYPWIFSNLKKEPTLFLDAGSTFNFKYILDHNYISIKKKYIYTYYPERKSYNDKKISYIYGDLRELPFKNEFFEEIVCQSTIEHIDMDNSIYGYDLESSIAKTANKSYEYLKVINELIRVLKPNGQLLLTFPYGKFENHGFFQQLDSEMVEKITDIMTGSGIYDIIFYKYLPNGWTIASKEDCNESESFNPHTQIGKRNDYAAHSRAICCLKFIKK